MRNLKKVLSLVLALAMVLSLCMAGAGAVNYDDFTDEGTITKKQAVETLVSLDVIQGFNDGATFAPTENVTRAQMATMICRVLAGGDNMIVDATKPVATYADIDGHWAESYVEYCSSLGIVSGKSPTSFDPDANVTAAEAAKMVMTTLGYNADIEQFKGIGWDINTMAKANTLKLLDNLQGEISANVPVTREQVAQLLFNALDKPMVQNYVGNSANTWIDSGANRYTQNLLEAKFNAEKITGVVVANEFADLYDTAPLGNGKTRLALMDDNNDITTNTKVVNLTTGQADLGMSVIVYCDRTTSRVVFGDTQDTGLNVVTEWTEKYQNITRGEKAVTVDKDTDHFVNYAENLENSAEVDHYFRIGLMEVAKAANGTSTYPTQAELTALNNDVDRCDRILTFRIGDELDATAYDNLETYIATLIRKEDNRNFNYDEGDEVTLQIGQNDRVYVAAVFEGRVDNTDAQNYTNRVEYSSFNGFSRYYLTRITSGNMTEIKDNENGNYIKAVDANSDGTVDYVMKVAYTMAKVDRLNRDDVVLTDDVKYTTRVSDDKNLKTIKGSDLDTADELSNGDVIVYFEADGVYHVNLAEVVTGVPTKVNYRTDVATVDGTDYTESGIGIGFRNEPNPEDMYAYVDNMEEEEATYNLYLDNYGYVRAWEEATALKDLMLLTRANTYMGNTSSTAGYAIEAYNNEESKIQGYDLDARRSNLNQFIDRSNNSFTNDWDKLLGVAMTDTGVVPSASQWANGTKSLTNMAAVTINDDNKMVAQYVDEATNREILNVYALDRQDIVNGTGIASRRLTTNEVLANHAHPVSYTGRRVSTDVEQGYVYTNRNTVYYVVNITIDRNGDDVVDRVRTYTGFNNLPGTIDAENIDAMYAVATLTDYNSNSTNTTKEWYYTANAVVIETRTNIRGNYDVAFLYDTHTGSVSSRTTVDLIDKTGADVEVTLTNQNLGDWTNAMGFYRVYDGETVAPILLGDYANERIYAGTVHTQNRADIVTTGGPSVAATTLYPTDDTPVYTFSLARAASTRDNVDAESVKFSELGSRDLVDKDIIWVTDDRDNALYIINVTDSFRSNVAAPRALASAPALGLALDNGVEANGNGYTGNHYEQTELYHVWGHVVNEPVFDTYEKLVNAWNDWNKSDKTDADTRAFQSVVDDVKNTVENKLKPSTLATLLSEANGLIRCEVSNIPAAWANDKDVIALDDLRLDGTEQDQLLADAEEEVTGETPTVKFYGVDATLSGDTFTVEVSHKTAYEWTQKEGNDAAKAIVLGNGAEEAFEGELATETLTGAVKTYNATIKGADGKVYKVVATKKVQDQSIGEPQMTGNSDTIALETYNIPEGSMTIFVKSGQAYTLESLAERLFTNAGDEVTVAGYDSDDKVLPMTTLMSAAGKIIVTITNSDLYAVEFKVTITENTTKSNVTVTLGEGVEAWTNADCTTAAPAGSGENTVKVAENTQLWFTHEGDEVGSFTVTPGTSGNTTIPATYVMKADSNLSRSSAGVTASAIGDSTVSFTADEHGTDSAFKTFTVPASNKELAGATVTEDGNTKLVEYTKDVNVNWDDVDDVVSFWLGLAKMPDGPVEGAVWATVDGRNDLYFDNKTSDCMSWTGFPCVSIKSVAAASGADHTLEIKTIGLNNGSSETWTVNFKKVDKVSSYVAYFLVASNNAIQISLYDNDAKKFLTQEELGKLGIKAGETDGTYETSTASITVEKTPVSGGQSVSIVSNSAHWRPAGGLTSGETLSGASQAGVLKFDISKGSVFTESTHSWYTVANGFIEGDGSAAQGCTAWTSDARLTISLTIDGKEVTISGLNGVAHANCSVK